jgi:hypothetical protein
MLIRSIGSIWTATFKGIGLIRSLLSALVSIAAVYRVKGRFALSVRNARG